MNSVNDAWDKAHAGSIETEQTAGRFGTSSSIPMAGGTSVNRSRNLEAHPFACPRLTHILRDV